MKLKGTQTINSIMDILNINRNQAIKYIHKLRKQGYVKTKRVNNIRVYNISENNKLNGIRYEEIINKNSPIKLKLKDYFIYRKKITLEETLIYAIKTKDIRTILASLSLFKKIKDWKLLYNLSKENKIERQVGILYDLSRTIIRTRKISKVFLKNSLPKNNNYNYLIKNLKSKDFKDLEKRWKIYLPFNKIDLEDYKWSH